MFCLPKAGFQFFICAISLSVSAEAGLMFSDSFVAPNGRLLNNHFPTVGSKWNVTSGTTRLAIQGDAVDTTTTPAAMTLAFSNFSQSLGSGETLTLSFNTANPTSGKFFTKGWAGISLYTGGSSGTEQFFFGSVATHEKWGISGAAVGGIPQLFDTINSAAQSVSFSYVYDTGAWSYTVGGQTKTGTASSGMAFNTIRIGAGEWDFNYADIKVLDIQATSSTVAPVPEPASCVMALLGVVYGGYSRLRTRKRQAVAACPEATECSA
jgi:hypothetical protein